ncbi:MAG: uracil-DNA glycosylase [Treponema sp.]|jgi:DNA polymerase|nr:uracil-DNA glycosylase [Treponema sp.]
MTKEEKAGAAAFLDLAGDYLSGGFRRERGKYAFKDDREGDPREYAVSRGSGPGNNRFTGDEETAPDGRVENGDSLEAVAAEVSRCKRCGLCTTRTNTVPGEGVSRPLVMVIGEGPGADEDSSGRPFVGRAGQLLDRMLDSRGKIGLSRGNNCHIANIVKCRPPGNRNPQPDETAACVPFLVRQIKLLRPKIILAAGNTAAKTLLDSSQGITRLRGTWTRFQGTFLMDGSFDIPLIPTFHPSALLRDESLKAPVWEDLKLLREKLCELDGDYAARMAETPL